MVSRMPNSYLQPLRTEQDLNERINRLTAAGPVGFIDEEPERELRLYVVFAEGRGDRVPWQLCDENDVGQVMMQTADVHGDGWTISVQDAEVVPTADMERLAARLSILDTWDEFIALPEGHCTACGGKGYMEMDQFTAACERYTERGDCEGCEGSGRL